MFIFGAGALLLLFLIAFRVREEARERKVEARFEQVLSQQAQETVDRIKHVTRSHQVGVDLCERAIARTDAEKLRRAVWVVESFAPGMWEGLRALWALSRTVDVIVALPPVRPLAWKAWRLRGLSALAVGAHELLVAGAERTRLRVWLIARAFRLCLRWLSASAAKEQPEWPRVRATVADLGHVGREVDVTSDRVIRSLDATGRLVEAVTAQARSRA